MKHVKGPPPFGRYFDRGDGRWKVNEEQAAVCRRIFELCLAGKSCKEIAATLNNEGVPGPKGNG